MTETANTDVRHSQAPEKHVSLGDAALVEQCKKGDSSAMERLIVKYQNRIYNVVLKICADPEDAAELTQETFVKIIQNLRKFEGRSGFYTWAFRIAVNLTLNHCQRSGRLSVRSLDAEQVQCDSSERQVLKDYLSDDSSPDAADVAQRKELYEIATKALLRLDESQRAVITLRDVEGMSYARIAEVLDIELGTVRSRLSRARSRLRDILEAMSR
ncbi:MAG: sigma-70 family RNA polymerase sigma factor [Phycisphaerales bacterium]|nr:MAG: sigma-70 family RNA polymerase sigma factor [Phycisphaerales bacterium]